MKPVPAILLTLLLIVLCVLLEDRTEWSVTFLMVLGTSAGIAIDSMFMGLRKYKSGISYHPVVLFVASCLLWVIAFPWYLIVRQRIRSGKAVLKDKYAATPEATAVPPPGMD